MVFLLGALCGLIFGLALGASIAYTFFRLGQRVAGDALLDSALDPGMTVGQRPTAEETTGPIPVVGETSGRHALPEWPSAEDTVVLRDEVRA